MSTCSYLLGQVHIIGWHLRILKQGISHVLKWEDVEIGEPSEGEIRMKNKAIGLNFIHMYFRKGVYKADKFPFTPASFMIYASKHLGSEHSWEELKNETTTPTTHLAYIQDGELRRAKKLSKIDELKDSANMLFVVESWLHEEAQISAV